MVQRQIYMNKVKDFIDKDVIKIITGIRRSGKSYFLKLIIDELINQGVEREDILLIDLELPQYNDIRTKEQLDEIILEFLSKHENKTYLFFDEIQNVSEWEIAINSYYKLPNVDIYITGSNSKLISKELATYLTGRYVSFEIYPFSFNEFLDYKKELNEKSIINKEYNTEIENYFEEYLTYGGLPMAIASRSNKELILNDLYSSIILNDIVERYDIRNIGIFRRIIKFLIENISNPVSGNSIFNYLKHDKVGIGKLTIYNYLEYLTEAYIFSKISREDLIGKKELNGSEKYYLIDQGFYKSQLEEKQRNTGRILENIVYLELLRKGYKITIGCMNDLEIDFVCRKDNEKIYIQVAYYLSSEETIEREFKPLLMINDNYPKYVLSMDKIDQSREGIEHVNIIKFLREFH